MTGACTIDGIDIATLGVLILRGGDHDLISFPSRKDPKYNDWPEEDGIEISDDDPVFNEKKVTAKYYLKGDETNFKSRVNAFLDLHVVAGYRSVYVREFDRTFQLRFIGVTGYEQNRGFSRSGEKSVRLDVEYSMDDPIQFLNPLIVAPASGRSIPAQVTINSIDLAQYGIVVHKVYSTALRWSVKQGLVISSKYRTGLIADVAIPPKRKMQRITLECTMIAPDRAAFWNNYNALWSVMSSSTFMLGLPAAMKGFRCYYSVMSGFSKSPWTGRVILKFNLEVVACSFEALNYLLAAESGMLIITEDGINYIDMN